MYPITLNLRGRRCLVVGGGAVAERKVQGLLAAEAKVSLVSPELSPALRELAQAGRIGWQQRAFVPEDAAGAFLIFAATNRPLVQQAVLRAAQEVGALVNVADMPEACDFQVPAVLRRDGLLLSVATSGASPALAAVLRARLEREIGPEYAVLARLLAALRTPLLKLPLSGPAKKMLFQKMLDSDILQWLRDGRKQRAAAHVEAVFGHLLPVGRILDALPDAPWTDTNP